MSGEVMLTVSFLLPLFTICGAAIQPVEENYTAKVGDDVMLTWIYDNENSMFSVDWTFQSVSAASPSSILTQDVGDPVEAANNFDVTHNGNGNITLKSVTLDSSGTYFCAVTYALASSLSPVTGTATLTVTGPTSTTTSTTSSTPSNNNTSFIDTTPASSISPITMPKTTTDDTDIIIGASVGGVIFVLIIICIIVCLCLRHKHEKNKDNPK